MTEIIYEENRKYWTGRAEGYSQVNQLELSSGSHMRWQKTLERTIRAHFPQKPMEELQILDIGTGPGFFAIILTELGCKVTAVDLTLSMLRQAEKNAGSLAGRIRFMEMNAEALTFPDAQFDVVITRNLTWNLPHPEKAYAQWCRVLKKEGLLLNFDANWYSYLSDETARRGFEQDRENSANQGIDDQNVGANFDVMEDIAGRLPLSAISRPHWDKCVLEKLGMCVTADNEIWQEVWSREEKTNFASTPMFMIQAVKSAD